MSLPPARGLRSMEATGRPPSPDDHDPVPIFGTWRAIYAAVVVCALLVMGLVALFSSWPY
jgi:hypothetical protein